MDRRQAAVFYMDVQYGSDKGDITAGQSMLSPLYGHAREGQTATNLGNGNGSRRYAIAKVVGESITESLINGATNVQLNYAPGVILGTVAVYNGTTLLCTDDKNLGATTGAGSLDAIASSGVAGTVTAAGVINFDSFADTIDSTGWTATYQYQHDLPTNATTGEKTGVPEVNLKVAGDTLTAIDFPIRAKYSIGASIDLLKAHGLNLENEIVKILGNEVKFTIDQYGLDMMYDAAQNGAYVDYTNAGTGVGGAKTLVESAGLVTQWNANVGTAEPWIFKKHEIKDRFESGSNKIFAATLRATGNFIVCGNTVARVIKQVDGFKASKGANLAEPTGPMLIGELDGRKVVQNPFMTTTAYYMGYRSSQYLNAAFVYAPYIPLFTSPTIVTSDLQAQKGFLSAAGFKVINPKMFCHGTITGTYMS